MTQPLSLVALARYITLPGNVEPPPHLFASLFSSVISTFIVSRHFPFLFPFFFFFFFAPTFPLYDYRSSQGTIAIIFFGLKLFENFVDETAIIFHSTRSSLL